MQELDNQVINSDKNHVTVTSFIIQIMQEIDIQAIKLFMQRLQIISHSTIMMQSPGSLSQNTRPSKLVSPSSKAPMNMQGTPFGSEALLALAMPMPSLSTFPFCLKWILLMMTMSSFWSLVFEQIICTQCQ
ncbi:Hypothetical_protein [Hexamita inflata]|uniref:Hypothetical_protein n=1 Tax=Hexamita inflata TaxID=28002 RepID=A0AA86NTK5_9EUKA|nr:Hypothetical protein HINF_LOCUS13468 [Hexamita inflata]